MRSRPALEMRPDVTVYRDGRPTLVVDAKWKRPAGAPSPADLYQMLAYCTALGVGRAVLVYPGRRDGVKRSRYIRRRSALRCGRCAWSVRRRDADAR